MAEAYEPRAVALVVAAPPVATDTSLLILVFYRWFCVDGFP